MLLVISSQMIACPVPPLPFKDHPSTRGCQCMKKIQRHSVDAMYIHMYLYLVGMTTNCLYVLIIVHYVSSLNLLGTPPKFMEMYVCT